MQSVAMGGPVAAPRSRAKVREVASPGAPGKLEKAFVVIVLLVSTAAFYNIGLVRATDDPGAGSSVLQALWTLLYVVTVGLIYSRAPLKLEKLRMHWPLVALVIYWLLSVLWAESPGITLRRGIGLLGTTLFAYYFASRFSMRDQLRMLAIMFAVANVCSLFFVIFGLGTPVEQIPGSWYGIYLHKNTLGRLMALSTIVYLVLWLTSKARPAYLVGLALSLVLLLGSRSVTAWLTFVTLLCIYPLYEAFRKSYVRGGLALGVVASGVAWVAIWTYSNYAEVMRFLGRDTSLTGRTSIWEASWYMIGERPWLGFGYSGFWTGRMGPCRYIWNMIGWPAPHSHNGILDIWLELGLIGVVLISLAVVIYFGRALRLIHAGGSREAVWPMLVFSFILLSNITERSLLSRNSLFWILFVSTAINVTQTAARRRVKSVAPQRGQHVNGQRGPSLVA